MKPWQKIALGIIVPGGVALIGYGVYELYTQHKERKAKEVAEGNRIITDVMSNCETCVNLTRHLAGAALVRHLVADHKVKDSMASSIVHTVFHFIWKERSNGNNAG